MRDNYRKYSHNLYFCQSAIYVFTQKKRFEFWTLIIYSKSFSTKLWELYWKIIFQSLISQSFNLFHWGLNSKAVFQAKKNWYHWSYYKCANLESLLRIMHDSVGFHLQPNLFRTLKLFEWKFAFHASSREFILTKKGYLNNRFALLFQSLSFFYKHLFSKELLCIEFLHITAEKHARCECKIFPVIPP